MFQNYKNPTTSTVILLLSVPRLACGTKVWKMLHVGGKSNMGQMYETCFMWGKSMKKVTHGAKATCGAKVWKMSRRAKVWKMSRGAKVTCVAKVWKMSHVGQKYEKCHVWGKSVTQCHKPTIFCSSLVKSEPWKIVSNFICFLGNWGLEEAEHKKKNHGNKLDEGVYIQMLDCAGVRIQFHWLNVSHFTGH